MIAKSAFILLAIVHSGQSIFFGGFGGGDCCSGGSYGGYGSQGYGQNYGYGNQGYSNYGTDYGAQNYAPQQTFVQQPRVITGKYIIRSKVYQPFIKRTTVQLIPQQGQVVKPYSTEFVPDSGASTGSSYSGGANYSPSYGSYGSSYGGGQAGYGGYGSSYGGQTGYGGQNYGGYGSSYGGQTGYGGLGSMFG